MRIGYWTPRPLHPVWCRLLAHELRPAIRSVSASTSVTRLPKRFPIFSVVTFGQFYGRKKGEAVGTFFCCCNCTPQNKGDAVQLWTCGREDKNMKKKTHTHTKPFSLRVPVFLRQKTRTKTTRIVRNESNAALGRSRLRSFRKTHRSAPCFLFALSPFADKIGYKKKKSSEGGALPCLLCGTTLVRSIITVLY